MPDPRPPTGQQPLDDVDRVFAHLERAPVPESLTAAVLASTVARPNAARGAFAWPWMIASLAALGLLSLAGYQIGATLAASDGLELLSALFEDAGLLTTAPGDVAAALGEVVPWGLLALGVVGAALLVLAVGRVVARAPAPGPTHQIV